jgi:prevent-host-death family protein
MVILGHLRVMEAVNIATLKAHLSEYLRRVRQGSVFVVLDRQSPVARIVPCDDPVQALVSRKPVAKLADYRIPKKPLCSRNSLDALLEERQSER